MLRNNFLIFSLLVLASNVLASSNDNNKYLLDKNALSIMQEVNKRAEQYPYVYEEQSMILMDKSENLDVRNMRRYSRASINGELFSLLVFDSPPEVRGVALRANLDKHGSSKVDIYLPAFENKILSTTAEGRSSQFLGSDFSVDDLRSDTLTDYHYKKIEDILIDDIAHYVIEAHPADNEVTRKTGYIKRIHTIRKDNFSIVKTVYFDRYGRLIKIKSKHELQKIDNNLWRANMILMENIVKNHKTLIKIKQRVFSADYVPSKIFSNEWLLNHKHMGSTASHLMDSVMAPVRASSVRDIQ